VEQAAGLSGGGKAEELYSEVKQMARAAAVRYFSSSCAADHFL